jgi:hypothetical protein
LGSFKSSLAVAATVNSDAASISGAARVAARRKKLLVIAT